MLEVSLECCLEMQLSSGFVGRFLWSFPVSGFSWLENSVSLRRIRIRYMKHRLLPAA